MTSEAKDPKSESKQAKSEKAKSESKPAKPEVQPPKGEGKGGKDKDKDKDKHKEKDKDKAAAEAAAEKPKAPPAPPRAPADPRLKYIKKFHGKFLPRGPLRDRHKALMARWDSGEDHGGVTAPELKALYEDWKATRAKTSRAVQS